MKKRILKALASLAWMNVTIFIGQWIMNHAPKDYELACFMTAVSIVVASVIPAAIFIGEAMTSDNPDKE